MSNYRHEGCVKEIYVGDDGSMQITTANSLCFLIPSYAKTDHVKVGDSVYIDGGWGSEIRGVIIGGIECFTRSQKDIDDAHRRWWNELREQKLKDYETNKVKWQQAVDFLPILLYNRMLRFINKAGGFEAYFKEDGSYELFCCTEAVKFSEYFKKRLAENVFTEEQLMADAQDFMNMNYGQQQSLVPFSDEHSGNTFGGAVQLGVLVALGKDV
jgi:hypothetical protein